MSWINGWSYSIAIDIIDTEMSRGVDDYLPPGKKCDSQGQTDSSGIVPSGNFTYSHEKMVPGPFASMMFDNLY